MSSDYDIKMSTDDTLELDTIIEQIDNSNSITKVNKGGNYSLNVIDTQTEIFDPIDSGEYELEINGQILSINVTDANAIPDEWVNNFESQDGISPTDVWGSETIERNDGTQADTWETSNPISGTASRKIASNGGGVQYSYTRSEPISPNVISGGN